MEFTEHELLTKYNQYVYNWNHSYGDGPLLYDYWRQEYLAKRTYSE